MTRISLSKPRNLRQVSLSKKRKFFYLNELPHSRDLFLKLKNSKKTNHRRWAKIVEKVNYFIQKGKGICYASNEYWVKILNKEGFKCCESTFDKDILALRKMGLIWTNSWTKPKRVRGGAVRHIITPWNLHQYEKNYIEVLNKKGKGKPDATKKSFYEYKEKMMKFNFPVTHNVPNFPPRKKITSPSDRRNTTYINIPPIIPLKGDEIAKSSRKRIRKRKRPPKIKKSYERIDENELKTHYDMTRALDRMLSQPQFKGREEQLKENFRKAYNLTHDAPVHWQKTPLHLAAHATLRGYDPLTRPKESLTQCEENYFELYDHLKWGDETYLVEPMSKSHAYKSRKLALELNEKYGEKLREMGYTIGNYEIKKLDLQSECSIKYNNPYLFAGMLSRCVDRGWDDVVEFMKSKLWNKTH